jgi:hypothetical protein
MKKKEILEQRQRLYMMGLLRDMKVPRIGADSELTAKLPFCFSSAASRLGGT